jgi:hypothetical protein
MQNRPALFRGRHFEDVIIILCVRIRFQHDKDIAIPIYLYRNHRLHIIAQTGSDGSEALPATGVIGKRWDPATRHQRGWTSGVCPRFIKKRTTASLGFRSAEGAWRTIEGCEAMHAIRKGQIRRLAKGDAVASRIHPQPLWYCRVDGRK